VWVQVPGFCAGLLNGEAMHRIALALLLFGMTGCAPCGVIDQRMAALPVGSPAPDRPHVLLQASTLGITARVAQAFSSGQSRFGDTRIAWSTLGLDLGDAPRASIGLRVDGPSGSSSGALSFPVRLRTDRGDGGFSVVLEPAGPGDLSLTPPLEESAEIVTQLAPLREGWVGSTPVVRFAGWYRPGEFLPLHVSDAVLDSSVVSVAVATGLPLPATVVAPRAGRPGMADDFTLAVSMPLLAALATGGWRPVPVAAEAAPAPPSVPGWTVVPLSPVRGPRGMRVPALARRSDRCAFAEVSVETSPALHDGRLTWRSPRNLQVAQQRGAEDPSLHDQLAAAALESLMAPLVPLPMVGPGAHPAVARIPRTADEVLLIDGLLGPSKAPLQRAPPGGARPRVSRPESGPPASP
jgi:hypothetical protein